jgi:hypothetical protein
MKKWIVLLIILLLTLGTYVVAGPYLTVRAIRTAVKDQDAAALSQQVNFYALRTSLKVQMTDQLVRAAGPALQANPFGAFGLSIAGGLVDGTVNAMVTPTGLSAMIEGRRVWKHFDEGLSTTDPDAPTPEPLHDAVYRYESLSRFTATVRNKDGQLIVFVLSRDGVQWRLSDIRLPR